jgi:pimeloyl-ACP methyl ester carboxylesterase
VARPAIHVTVSLWLAVLALSRPVVGQERCDDLEVDGRSVHYCRAGAGEPIIVLEAGMRSDHGAWRRVMPSLSALGTVVAYDRAGMGRSVAAPPPRTSDRIATELRGLLQGLALPGPYIMVGHSIGGRHVRTFAAMYPADVRAVLLLDSPHERFEEQRLNLLTPAERQARIDALAAQRSTLPAAVQLEYEGIADSDPPGPMPPVPLLVVSAGRHAWQPESSAAAHELLWRQGQAQIAATSTLGQLVTIPNAGHNIQMEQPDSVVAAVESLLLELQGR